MWYIPTSWQMNYWNVKQLALLCFVLAPIYLVPVRLQAQSVEDIIMQHESKGVHWSISVIDEQGQSLESWNDQKWIVPASNMKLVTSAAVLEKLGTEFRYQTPIYGRGYLEDSVWVGDLMIVGKGDPSISGFLYEENRYHVFEELLHVLKNAGITGWTGQWIGRLGYFDAEVYPKGWDWDDLNFYYGVEISELSFNNNAVDLEVVAEGEIGAKPQISWFPDQTDYVRFINEQRIAPAHTKYDEYYRRSWQTNELYLASSLPVGYKETEALAIYDAPAFFMDSFVDYLWANGLEDTQQDTSPYRIERWWPDVLKPETNESLTGLASEQLGSALWTGYPPNWYATNSASDALVGWEYLGAVESPELGSLVSWLNKESDNFYAEMLLKTLSAETHGGPGSTSDGVQKTREILGSMGLDTTYVIMRDGSGLAGGNFLTTSFLTDLLFSMHHSSNSETYRASLPVMGEDGTLHYRMKSSPLRGRVQAKTGFVGGARSLSGYLTTELGNTLIFSMSANNFVSKVSAIDAVHEKILTYLYYNY